MAGCMDYVVPTRSVCGCLNSLGKIDESLKSDDHYQKKEEQGKKETSKSDDAKKNTTK